MFHTLFHWFTGCWETTENLPAPGYTGLVQQRCTVCQATRVTDLRPLARTPRK